MLTKKQIQSVYKEIQKNPHVVAILVTGSYVYGTPNEKSDLDIRMIVDDKKYEKAHWDDVFLFNVRIEAFYNTVETVESFIEKAQKKEMPPNIVHFWANGKIVYDPQGVAKKLKAKAKEIWESGPYEGTWTGL